MSQTPQKRNDAVILRIIVAISVATLAAYSTEIAAAVRRLFTIAEAAAHF